MTIVLTILAVIMVVALLGWMGDGNLVNGAVVFCYFGGIIVFWTAVVGIACALALWAFTAI